MEAGIDPNDPRSYGKFLDAYNDTCQGESPYSDVYILPEEPTFWSTPQKIKAVDWVFRSLCKDRLTKLVAI